MTDVLDWVRKLRPADESEESGRAVLAQERDKLMASIQPGEAVPAMPRMISQLAYRDLDAALQFLTDAFGFQELEDARFIGTDGRVGHAEMETRSGVFMLGQGGGHGLSSPQTLGGVNQMLCVYVEDLDAHFERARAAGAVIRAEIEEKFWGDRTYEADDLEGHRWAFHQQVRQIDPQDLPGPAELEDEG